MRAAIAGKDDEEFPGDDDASPATPKISHSHLGLCAFFTLKEDSADRDSFFRFAARQMSATITEAVHEWLTFSARAAVG